jgi:hypothetical protein
MLQGLRKLLGKDCYGWLKMNRKAFVSSWSTIENQPKLFFFGMAF